MKKEFFLNAPQLAELAKRQKLVSPKMDRLKPLIVAPVVKPEISHGR